MRFEKGHKAATRQRIIDVAAARFRKDGMAGVGIAGLMADAGLTHGGFYAHFESKEVLLREAMDAAMDATQARLDQAAITENGQAGLEALVRTYLRPAHRDNPQCGCTAAALLPEIARQPEDTRASFTTGLKAYTARLARHLPTGLPEAEKQAKATAIFATMLGCLQLARAVDDAKLSSDILQAGISAAMRLAQADPAEE